MANMTLLSAMHVVIALAVMKLVMHIATNGQYGFHRDELQTLADARHLDWGYVAYPPLTPFIARISLTLFGTSLRGFRFFAALAGSVSFIVVAMMARRFGGGRAAQIMAALAAAIAPLALASGALMQYVAFDYLWYLLLAYFVIALIDSGDERWWIAIGAAIGLAVLTKYTIAFFLAGLAGAVFFTSLRVHLRSRWLWIGAAVSILIAAPNLIWQAQHDFISLDFLKHIHERDIKWGRTQSFFKDQLYIASNAVTVPLWLLGLYAVFRDRKWRAIGWMAVIPFVIFVVVHGRGYYTAPLFPMLIAAGAVKLERWAVAIDAVLAIGGVAVALVALPITPIHSRPWSMNGDFVEELGWPELTQEVARIYKTIPPSEHAGIFGNNYGEAGAIELYGAAYGLPHPISATNSFWLRGPGTPAPRTLVILGERREVLDRVCSQVTLAGHTPNPWNVKNEEVSWHPDIFICRGLKKPLEQRWPKMRAFG
jgi:4-amino-4-deoxy-L-arabinose transferase-like glycosyltransferase